MRRVSSRQRLVSWDRFDATETIRDDRSVDSGEISVSGYETSLMAASSSGSVSSLPQLVDDFPLKRKRTNKWKQEPIQQEPVSIQKPLLQTASSHSDDSDCSFLTAVSTTSTISEANIISAYPSEVVSEPNSFLSLNSDVKMHIFNFLDLGSIRNTMQVNHSTRNLLLSDASETLWKEFCARRWSWIDPEKTHLQDALQLPTAAGESPFCNLSLLLSLASKTISRQVDESIFMPCRWSRSLRRYTPRRSGSQILLKTVTTRQGEQAVQFIGAVGQGDRCIRADEPLPRPELLVAADVYAKAAKEERSGRSLFLNRFRNRSLRKHRDSSKDKTPQAKITKSTNNWRPFVAPFCSAKSGGEQVLQVTPRLVSYFEVSILEAPAVSEDGKRTVAPSLLTVPGTGSSSTPECVAVGLASQEFALHTRMPGWDPHSFGYHGDDGGIFHAAGSMLQHYGPTYGVGDVVGCGIDYLNGRIFYTLNGKFLGAAFSKLSPDVLQQDWFPVVGLDSNCLVQCNFGCDRPFCFDLSKMIQEQKESLVEGVTTVHPKA